MKYLIITSDMDSSQVEELDDDTKQMAADGEADIFRFENGGFEFAEVTEQDVEAGEAAEAAVFEIDWVSV